MSNDCDCDFCRMKPAMPSDTELLDWLERPTRQKTYVAVEREGYWHVLVRPAPALFRIGHGLREAIAAAMEMASHLKDLPK